ncbi:MAG: FAD-binding monooxygenase [Actinomycetota bacterium]|nr:FAD-binding monooxygenase [Actinomycetota bacterium]MDQ3899984.1 FAD-binding monooxygenase [Actinomycetota bacterium]
MNGLMRDHAVVLGASFAGLLAARVLADVYTQVTIIDRDELPETNMHRRGVPQGHHVHGLLAAGQQALEELFPGFTEELVSHGVPTGDMLANSRLYFSGHRLRRAHAGLVVLCPSRPCLEGHIRAKIRALPNVALVDRRDVVGLATTPDHRRVTGARVLRRTDGSAEEVLSADLVVDAMGRGSRTPAWLEALGYARPDKEQVGIRLGYATRTYRLRHGALGGNLAVLHGATLKHPRAGVLQLIEGDQSMLTLAGILGDFPPTDPGGFLDFAGSLQFPDIYQAIQDAEPLDDPIPFRYPASVRHRYERLTQCPDRFVVMGDAMCHTNPLYGHGMSIAALEALALRRHLTGASEPAPLRFFQDLARIVDMSWDIAVGGDLVFPGVEGRRTPKIRLSNSYLARYQAAAAHDATLATAFVRVAALIDPPQALLRPGLALRVFQRRRHPAPMAGRPMAGQH